MTLLKQNRLAKTELKMLIQIATFDFMQTCAKQIFLHHVGFTVERLPADLQSIQFKTCVDFT